MAELVESHGSRYENGLLAVSPTTFAHAKRRKINHRLTAHCALRNTRHLQILRLLCQQECQERQDLGLAQTSNIPFKEIPRSIHTPCVSPRHQSLDPSIPITGVLPFLRDVYCSVFQALDLVNNGHELQWTLPGDRKAV